MPADPNLPLRLVLEPGTERWIDRVDTGWGALRVKRDVAVSTLLHVALLGLLFGFLPHWHDTAPPPQAVQLVIEEPPSAPPAETVPEPAPPKPASQITQTSEESVKGDGNRGSAQAPAPPPSAIGKPTRAASPEPVPAQHPQQDGKAATPTPFEGTGTTSLEHSAYLAGVKRQILQFGYKLDDKLARGRTGSVMVAVFVSNDGKLMSTSIENSSGFRDIDRAATQMVELAAPFPPLPAPSATGGIKLGFEVEFPYVAAPPK
jgi:protein TonB